MISAFKKEVLTSKLYIALTNVTMGRVLSELFNIPFSNLEINTFNHFDRVDKLQTYR